MRAHALWRSFLEAAEKVTPVTASRDHRTSALCELQAPGMEEQP